MKRFTWVLPMAGALLIGAAGAACGATASREKMVQNIEGIRDAMDERTKDWGFVNKLQVILVEVDEDYGMASKVSLPGYTSELLNYTGLTFIRDRTKRNDAVLHIGLKGEPLGANYRSFSDAPGGWLFTGARIEGELTLRRGDTSQILYTVSISGRTSPSEFTGTGWTPRDPNEAPFEEVFAEAFLPQLLKMTVYLGGVKPLTDARRHVNLWLQWAAEAAEQNLRK